MGPGAEKQKALTELLKLLGIEKKDLEERFIKASGRGGQKVNKRSSAVFIRHTKTGLSVKYGRHRSQDLNRFMALRSLAEKIQTQISGHNPRQEQMINKRRKQKKRNQARARARAAAQKEQKNHETKDP